MSTTGSISLLAMIERRLNNYGLGIRIVGLAFVPIALLILLSGSQSWWAYQEYRDNTSVQKLASLSVSISDVLNELQKESGQAAIFLGKEGEAEARQLLLTQISATDVELEALKAGLDDISVELFDEAFLGKISLAKDLIDGLAQMRDFVLKVDFAAEARETARIDALSFIEKQMMAARITPIDHMSANYAALSAALIDIINTERQYVSDPEISQQISGLLALTEIMELAARERALIAAGYSVGTFETDEYVRFLNLLGQQEAMRSVFRNSVQPHIEQLFQEKMKGEAQEQVDEIRYLIVDLEGGSMMNTGYTAEDWYSVASARIALIKQVADQLSVGIIEAVTSKAHTAFIKVWVFGIGVGVVALLVVFSVNVSRSISGPLTRLNRAMVELAKGNLDAEVPCLDYSSEIGSMAQAVDGFKTSSMERVRLESEAREMEEEKRIRDEARRKQTDELKAAEQKRELEAAHERDARSQKMEQRMSVFDRAILEQINAFNDAITQMEATAVTMSEIARQTQAQSVAAASGAAQTSSNVQTVSSATEEVASSVSEISQQMEHSSTISNEAIRKVDVTTEIASHLAESSKNIGNVISLINEIAEQTNLLALNATIEAARAGDAGLGFAVVASEVKELANQTSNATKEISGQIQQIQVISDKVVATIKETRQAIQENSEVALSVNAATEQQSYATREILQNIQQAAKGTESVSSQIKQVEQGAASALSASEKVQASSQILADTSSRLKSVIQDFLGDIRKI